MNIWQSLEIAGVAVGLLYLYFEYKASVWLWLTGIVMPAIYIFVYYESGFYADMGINIYYLFAGFYGWAVWLGKGRTKSTAATKSDQAHGAGKTAGAALSHAPESSPENAPKAAPAELPITRTPRKYWLSLTLVALGFFVVISYILINFTDSTVPLGDSFTTALSVVALWMLARKYVEQWLVWIVVDLISSGLYFYKSLHPTGMLYAFYGVVAVFGYFKWLKLMRERQ